MWLYVKKKINIYIYFFLNKNRKLSSRIKEILKEKKVLNFQDINEFFNNYYNCNLPFWANDYFANIKCWRIDEVLCFISEFRDYNKLRLIRMLKGELFQKINGKIDQYRIFNGK